MIPHVHWSVLSGRVHMCGLAYGIQDYTHVNFEEEYVPLLLNFRFLVLEGRGINTLIP